MRQTNAEVIVRVARAKRNSASLQRVPSLSKWLADALTPELCFGAMVRIAEHLTKYAPEHAGKAYRTYSDPRNYQNECWQEAACMFQAWWMDQCNLLANY